MAGGYRLNPYEQSTLQAIIAALGHPGTADLATSIGMPVIAGAQQRRQTNLDERTQGLQQLQQQAAQMAAQGATEDAIMSATLGQANDLPMMNGPHGQGALGDLASYIGGLDWQNTSAGTVSGLAPADYRSQFTTSTGGLDQADQAAIGGKVVSDLQQGIPFVQIREDVRRTAIGAGMDEAQIAMAISQAEQMYGQATGMDLSSMRGLGDQLRNIQTQTPDWLSGLAGFAGADPSTVNIQQYLGQQANTPGALQALASQVATYQPYQPSGWAQAIQNIPNYLPGGSHFLEGGLMGS